MNSPATTPVRDSAALWINIARAWGQVGPPMRPEPRDQAFLMSAIILWEKQHGAPRFLLMGVTPEIHRLLQPKGLDLLAVDHTFPMIRAVWPGESRGVVCADWLHLPLKPGSRDIAFTDAGFALVPPGKKREFVSSLRRVLSPNGLFVTRMFMPAAQGDSLERIFDDLLAGRIPGRDVFKLRLFTALQTDPERGVSLHEVWEAMNQFEVRFPECVAQLAWWPEQPIAIAALRNSPTRIYSVTHQEMVQHFCAASQGFRLEKVDVPDYAGGDQCPTYHFRCI